MSFEAVAALLGDSVDITRRHYAVFSPDYLQGVVDSIARARAAPEPKICAHNARTSQSHFG
jgi:hypothetical protein